MLLNFSLRRLTSKRLDSINNMPDAMKNIQLAKQNNFLFIPGALSWLILAIGVFSATDANDEALQAVTQGNNLFSSKLYDVSCLNWLDIRTVTNCNLFIGFCFNLIDFLPGFTQIEQRQPYCIPHQRGNSYCYVGTRRPR